MYNLYKKNTLFRTDSTIIISYYNKINIIHSPYKMGELINIYLKYNSIYKIYFIYLKNNFKNIV